jgi:hypothetical protein
MSIKSKRPCPKCGKYDWWHGATYLNKGGKTVTIVSYCDSCHTFFKRIKRLVRIDARNYKILHPEELEELEV